MDLDYLLGFMLYFMEKLADVILRIAEVAKAIALRIILIFAGVILFFTMPIWIVPYLIWHNKKITECITKTEE